MDTLNAFYKTVLLFVPGESCKLSKHIHAGYSSCVRECEKRVDKSDAFVEETFRGVRFVFGGVGLCLVWTRACLVLHGEIHIPRQCETIPLFFSVCHVSTGEDMASFLFQRLKQMHTPFSKLSSVVTDGANNIIGRENGTVSNLKRLIQNETRNDDFSFPSVWCMSHRLNLVVRGFEIVDNIKHFLKFSDWFASKRKAVAYRRWLLELHPQDRYKKIPKPSETRWRFYREVICALLDQREAIDEFLRQDDDFVAFRRSLWQHDESIDALSNVVFMNNPFILSHFFFAHYILERICNVNTQLQQRYMTVPQAWCLVQRLKEAFSHDMSQITSGNYGDFGYFVGMRENQIPTFKTILTALLLNLDIRFACPSFSIDTRAAHRNLDQTTQRLNKEFLKRVQRQCPLYELVGVYLFQDDLIKKRLINPLFISGKYPEVPLLAREILDKEEMFRNKTGQSTERTEKFLETEILTLSDVFQKIEKDKYPHLWNLTRRLISVTPTSTSCEQSFSCLKRRLHENMKKTTAFNFLLTSRNNSVFHL